MNNSLSVDTSLTQLQSWSSSNSGPTTHPTNEHLTESQPIVTTSSSTQSPSNSMKNGIYKGTGVTQQEVASFFSPAEQNLSSIGSNVESSASMSTKDKFPGRPEITKIHSRVHTRILIQTGSTTQAKTFTYHQQYPATSLGNANARFDGGPPPSAQQHSWSSNPDSLEISHDQTLPLSMSGSYNDQQSYSSPAAPMTPGDSELDHLAMQMGLLTSVPVYEKSAVDVGGDNAEEAVIEPSKACSSSSMSPSPLIMNDSLPPVNSPIAEMRHKRSRTGGGLLSGLLRRFSPKLKRRSKSISPSRQLNKSSSVRGPSPSVHGGEEDTSASRNHSRTDSREHGSGGNAFTRFFRSKRFTRNGSRTESFANSHSNVSSALHQSPSDSVDDVTANAVMNNSELSTPQQTTFSDVSQQLNLKMDSLRRDRVSHPYDQLKNSLQLRDHPTTPMHSSIGSGGSVTALKAIHPLPKAAGMSASLTETSPTRPFDLRLSSDPRSTDEPDLSPSSSTPQQCSTATKNSSNLITTPTPAPSYIGIAVSAFGYGNYYNYGGKIANSHSASKAAAPSPPPDDLASSSDISDPSIKQQFTQQNNNNCASPSKLSDADDDVISQELSHSNATRGSVGVGRSQSSATDRAVADDAHGRMFRFDEDQIRNKEKRHCDDSVQTPNSGGIAMRRKRTRSTSEEKSEARQRSSLIMMQVAQASPRSKFISTGGAVGPNGLDIPSSSLTRSFTAGTSGQENSSSWSSSNGADWQTSNLSFRYGHSSSGVSPLTTPKLMTPTMECTLQPIGEILNISNESDYLEGADDRSSGHRDSIKEEPTLASPGGMGPEFGENNFASECSGGGSDVKDGRYFLLEVARVENEILQQIHQVEVDLLESSKMSEEVDGQLRTAVGKANLLIHDKFAQFRGLCDQNLSQQALGFSEGQLESGHFLTLSSDLEGFWAMVELQISDIHRMFHEIDQLRAQQWTVPQPTEDSPFSEHHPSAAAVKPLRKRAPASHATAPTAGASSTPKHKENARAAEARKRLLAAKREAMQKMRENNDHAALVENSGIIIIQ